MTEPAYLEEFAARAASILGVPVEASITMRRNGVIVRGASSSGRAARCDQVEAQTGLGACIDAMDQVVGQIIPDLSRETRWEPWRDAAMAEGFRSALAVPALATPDTPISLNLYSELVDPWTPALITAADSYVQLLGAAIRLRIEASQPAVAIAVDERLSDAEVVEQAVGALMHLNRCSATIAHRVIEGQALSRGLSMRDVAESLLEALGPVESGWAAAANLDDGVS